MRLFLAIYPTKDYLDYIRDTLRGLDKQKRNINSTPLSQIHLTARFFGKKVSKQSKDILANELMKHTGSFPKPKVEINRLQLGFPRQKKPRVLMLNVVNNDELDDFTNYVHRLTKSLKLRDTINWKQRDHDDHHITFARLKKAAVNNSTIRKVQKLVDNIDLEMPEPFVADHAFLVRSNLTNTGPVYQKLEQISL